MGQGPLVSRMNEYEGHLRGAIELALRPDAEGRDAAPARSPRPLDRLVRSAGAGPLRRTRSTDRRHAGKEEQETKSVTHVLGLICYLCPRPLTHARRCHA